MYQQEASREIAHLLLTSIPQIILIFQWEHGLFTSKAKIRFLSKFRMKFWSERVDPAAHLELRRFSYSGWKRWISDPDCDPDDSDPDEMQCERVVVGD